MPLAVYVIQSAIFFKHEAYKNEQEFRLLQVYSSNAPIPDLRRRFRAYEMVKYKEFDWRSSQPDALKRIVVGPAADREKAVRFAVDCGAAFHKGPIEIAVSPIPYRAL